MNDYLVQMPLLLLDFLMLHVARIRGTNLNSTPSPLRDIPKIVDTAKETRQQSFGAFPVRESP
jgi:hypothetical protein